MNKIEYYFDFLSPFSYLSWVNTRDQNYEFEYFPVSLPNIISHYETKGPGQIKPKRDFLARELFRYKTIHNIPFMFPKNIPFNSLYALRLSLKSVAGESQKKLIDIFFRAAWEHGLDLGDSSVIEKLLLDNGFDKTSLMDKISSKEVKLELRSNIDRALKQEVFGVPSFIVDNELFWGNDSIKYLNMKLNHEDPLPKNEYEKFLNDFPM
jgi:2-hydroxychromene-2-carboxylate isomerase